MAVISSLKKYSQSTKCALITQYNIFDKTYDRQIWQVGTSSEVYLNDTNQAGVL